MCIKRGINAQLIPAIVLGLIVISISVSNAQNSCSQTLKEAQKSYELGQLNNIPQKLEGCMGSGFSKIEKQQAYRLIILTYLFLDEYTQAEKWMNDLLVFEPDYKPNTTLDPIEYINLYNVFRVEPVISFGVMIGLNRTGPNVLHKYGVGNTDAKPSKYNPGMNFNISAIADVLIYRSLFATVEGSLVFRNYNSSSSLLYASETTSSENQTWVDVPLTLKYVFGKGKFKPFVRAGGVANLILSSNAQLIRKVEGTTQNEYAGPNVDLTSQRNTLNVGAVVGLGFTYKIGYGFLIFDARYIYGFSNITNISKRYSNFNSQLTNYGYMDSDLSLNSIQVSLGYMYSLYKVKKLKKNY